MARAHVHGRGRSVHVLPPHVDIQRTPLVRLPRIDEVIGDGTRHIDLDSTNGVNRAFEAPQVDDDAVVDRDPESAFHHSLEEFDWVFLKLCCSRRRGVDTVEPKPRDLDVEVTGDADQPKSPLLFGKAGNDDRVWPPTARGTGTTIQPNEQ